MCVCVIFLRVFFFLHFSVCVPSEHMGIFQKRTTFLSIQCTTSSMTYSLTYKSCNWGVTGLLLFVGPSVCLSVSLLLTRPWICVCDSRLIVSELANLYEFIVKTVSRHVGSLIFHRYFKCDLKIYNNVLSSIKNLLPCNIRSFKCSLGINT